MGVECTYEINDKRFEQVIQGQRVKRIKTGPLPEIFLSLTVMVDVEQTADVTETAYFNFIDTDEHIIVKVNELQLILNMQPICVRQKRVLSVLHNLCQYEKYLNNYCHREVSNY